jgi:hypothetical protein
MSDSASLVYTVPQGGARPSTLEAAVAAVPISTDILWKFGIRTVSDVTVAGPPIRRTVNVSLVWATAPTATAQTLGSQPTGSPVETVTVGAAGSGLVAPPGVRIADALGTGRDAAAKAFLDVASIAITNAGASYGPNTFALAYGGLPPGNGSVGQTSFMFKEVLRADMTAGGVGYSPKTVVTFVGGLSPRGKPAKGAVILRNGSVVGIDIDDEGDEYLTAPRIVITDPTGAGSGASAVPWMVDGKKVYFQGRAAHVTVGVSGGGSVITIGIPDSGEGYISPPEIILIDPALTGSGAVLTPSMEVGKIVVTNGGEGYQQPVVTLIPYFKVLFPDSGDQRAPLFNLLTVAISKATKSQVVASAPVMS